MSLTDDPSGDPFGELSTEVLEIDDLAPLHSADSAPCPRPPRVEIISRPLSLDERSSDDVAHDRQISRELASRRLTIARREQRHRHTVELAEQRHRHAQRLARRRQEARIVGAVLLLVVVSGFAWITMPLAEAAQIVFTTSFGAVAGYLGARTRERDSRRREA